MTTPSSKQELAYYAIRSRIESGEYGPAQRLVIDRLSKELDVSPVPVREAIRRLEAEGLVTYHANSGPQVSEVSLEQWRHSMEVLAVLEGYATAGAAPFMTSGDISALKTINREMAQALKAFDLTSWSNNNRRFHETIFGRCPNKGLTEEIERTRRRVDSLSRSLFSRDGGVIIHTLGPERGGVTISDHEAIIAALEKPEPFHRIEMLTREHVLTQVHATLRVLDEDQGAPGP